LAGYGLTETSPVSHILPYFSKNFGSCGGPVPATLAAIRDVSTGEFLGPNKRGELVIKGPQVMVGYYKNPNATAETIQDGWLRTGDVGFYDEKGYFSVVDRVKELIKVKGLQVSRILPFCW
jgi:long-subunit acyl-CoA synthetase (AMP-forming)